MGVEKKGKTVSFFLGTRDVYWVYQSSSWKMLGKNALYLSKPKGNNFINIDLFFVVALQGKKPKRISPLLRIYGCFLQVFGFENVWAEHQ